MAFFRNRFLTLPVLTGILLWLSFPGGGDLWPLLTVALVPLLLAVQEASPRQALAAGLGAGLVHFLLLLYWIIIVLNRYGGLAWFVAILALLLLACYMSLYVGLFALLARVMVRSLPAPLVIWLLPALWVGLDWIRGAFLTGFPWMDLGYALYRVPLLIQSADLAGHHGLTFVIVLINCCLALLLGRRRSGRTWLLMLVPTLGLLGGVAYYSVARHQAVAKELAAGHLPHLSVGIVQGNIDQSIKWSPAQQRQTVESYLSLTEGLFQAGRPALVVWPETALPFYPVESDYLRPIEELVAVGGFALLTGAPWYEVIDREAGRVNFFNSALLFQPDGALGGRYDKTHLVPFGEYVPARKLLPFLEPLVEAVGDFSAGRIERPLVWQEARLGVLICFESVFPELSRRWVRAGANVLVNLTNDAWYGKSSAPHHSLAMAVLRAVETRRSLIRSANTGISAFITPLGALAERSGLFVPWAAASEVVVRDELTFWVRYGHRFGPLCLALAFCGVAAAWLAAGRRPPVPASPSAAKGI